MNDILSDNKHVSTATINLILSLLIIVIDITPFFSRNITRAIPILLTTLWIMSCFMFNKGKTAVSRIDGRVILWTICYYVLQVLYKMLGISDHAYNEYINRVCVYYIPLLLIVSHKYYNNKQKRILRQVIFAVFIINLIQNV